MVYLEFVLALQGTKISHLIFYKLENTDNRSVVAFAEMLFLIDLYTKKAGMIFSSAAGNIL